MLGVSRKRKKQVSCEKLLKNVCLSYTSRGLPHWLAVQLTTRRITPKMGIPPSPCFSGFAKVLRRPAVRA